MKEDKTMNIEVRAYTDNVTTATSEGAANLMQQAEIIEQYKSK